MYEKIPRTTYLYTGNYRKPEINDKLEGLKPHSSNAVEIFYRNYMDWVIYYNAKHLGRINIGSIVDKFDGKIKNGQPIYGPSNLLVSKLLEFANAEIILFNENLKSVFGVQKKEKWKLYVKHIKENLWRYDMLDKISHYLNPNVNFIEISSIAEGKIHNGFVNLKTLDDSIKRLFLKADRLYWMNELDNIHTKPLETYENLEKNLSQYFDFEHYKSPATLQEFPEDKIIYLKTLKTWLLTQLDRRKKKLGFKVLPPPHAFIENYALSLTDTIREVSTGKENNSEINKIEVIAEDVPDYPRYIFKDYKSYQFFNLFVSQLVSKVQISFLYRMMSEQEKPAMIVVKDTPFREWFNGTEHQVKLNSTTDTYLKSNNADRRAMYNISKDLFFNN